MTVKIVFGKNLVISILLFVPFMVNAQSSIAPKAFLPSLYLLLDEETCEAEVNPLDEQDNQGFSAALTQLDKNISGLVNLSQDELHTLRDTLNTTRTDFELSTSNIKAAAATVESYETNFGSLFTNDGTKTYPTKITSGDGFALERAMHEVYLAIMTSIDSDLINSNPCFVDGLAFGSSSYFPGAVPLPEDPNKIYEMQINASVPENWGRPNKNTKIDVRRPTGTYLAPGTIAEVTVPAGLVNKGYKILVGANSWNMGSRPNQRRIAIASIRYPIKNTVTKVANPLGGNIYIEAPLLAEAGIVTVKFKNTIRAPFFSARGFDKMTNAEWLATERLHPGAWADFESDKTMLSVPSKWVRNHDDPVALMKGYDAIMDVISDYVGKPRIRNKTVAFLQVDVDLRGSVFSIGYPTLNYGSFSSSTPRNGLLDISKIPGNSLLHEMGHGTWVTQFQNETEAIVHMLKQKVATKLYGYTPKQSFGVSLTHSENKNITLSDALNSWVLRPSFVDNVNMNEKEAGYRFAGHADYVEINELFGEDTMSNFNYKANTHYEATNGAYPNSYSRTDRRILVLSQTAGADLRPLIHLWGVKPVNAADLKRSIDDANLLPSAKIYDRMIEYKSTVPVTQAEFDVFYKKMSSSLSYPDFWKALSNDFDPARGTAAIARIDELIRIYFPEGRPNTGK